MENHTNKIYATIDERGIVVGLFSSVFEKPKETDKLIEEGNEEYHAHVHQKYKLFDEKGRYNYKYEGDKMVLLTEEEKEKLFPQAPEVVEMSAQEKLNAQLIKDNAGYKMQLALLTKQIAELKNGGKQ